MNLPAHAQVVIIGGGIIGCSVAVAKRAGIPRESPYRVLSAKGNPRWSTLAPVVRATGLKIGVIRPA